MAPTIRNGIRRLFRLELRDDARAHADLDAELAFHLAARTEQLRARGWSPDAARAESLRRLGIDTSTTMHDVVQQKEERIAMRQQLEDLAHDLRYAVRGMLQRPVFTLVAVLTLAVGIGANTAIFSAIDAMLLRALPFRNPSRLIDIIQMSPYDPNNGGSSESPWSYEKFITFRDAQRSYQSVALYGSGNFILTGDHPERVEGDWISAQLLSTLGVRIGAGHDIPIDEDAHPGAPRIVLISDALWQRRYAADPAVIGTTLRIDTTAYQIVGVLPPQFRGLGGKADVMVPITSRTSDNLGAWGLEFSMVGRLRDGVTVEQAASEGHRLAAVVYAASPMDANSLTSAPSKGSWDIKARTLNSVRVAPAMRVSLLVLFGAVVLVLLIACVNIASLLLGRAASRRQEIAVRLAIGAGRGRLIRLLLAESGLLAVMGGALSMLLAWWGAQAIRALDSGDALQSQGLSGAVGVVSLDHAQLDGRALLFTFVITFVVAILFGLAPALQATRAEITDELKRGGGAAGRGAGRTSATRRVLTVVEIALALVLLGGAGLMLRSLGNTMAIDPGFDSSHLLTLRVAVPDGVLARDSMPGFVLDLQARLAALPGVQKVGLSDCPPLSSACNGTLMQFPDRVVSNTGNSIVGVHWVTPDWFSALHVPLKRGRNFAGADDLHAPKVVLISETAARRYWPHEDPIGRPVKVFQGGFHTGATVIGIVGDVRYNLIDSLPVPEVYIPYAQSPHGRMMAYIRTAGEPMALVSAARRVLHDVAPSDPVYDLQTMDARVGAATSQARFSARLLMLFAGMALGLAVIGIYGVMSFGVTERSREIGIRMALGADRQRVLSMIVREGATLTAIGIAVGLAGSAIFGRVLSSTLYGVQPGDPLTYVVIIALLSTASLLASWVPARRASRVDAVEVLRRS